MYRISHDLEDEVDRIKGGGLISERRIFFNSVIFQEKGFENLAIEIDNEKMELRTNEIGGDFHESERFT